MSVAALPEETKQMQHRLKEKTSVNLIIPDM